MALTFEWDARKANPNIEKHGVSFDEALTVFSDPAGRLIADPKYSHDEFRVVLLGNPPLGDTLRSCSRSAVLIASASSVPGQPRAASAVNMKKPVAKVSRPASRVAEDEMLPEYDFSKGKRNVDAARFAAGATVVVLDPDVAHAFPDSAAVNQALRTLAEVARRPRRKARSKRRTA